MEFFSITISLWTDSFSRQRQAEKSRQRKMNGVILTNTDTDEDKTLLVNTWRDVTFQLKPLLSGVYIYLWHNIKKILWVSVTKLLARNVGQFYYRTKKKNLKIKACEIFNRAQFLASELCSLFRNKLLCTM